MPAASAWLTGSLKASLSTTASAIPSALAEIAVLVALTISATIESLEPVHWNSQLSSEQASWAPYWVGVKNGLVVTWLTKTNCHFGVDGKSPAPAAAASPLCCRRCWCRRPAGPRRPATRWSARCRPAAGAG